MQPYAPFWESLVFDGIGDVDVEAVTAAFGTVEVVAKGRAAGGLCPDCGRFSDRVHDRYQRRLKDLPLAEQGFVIRLTVRRFICGAADCQRRTFAEPFSGQAAPHARFTKRLNHALERVGLALAGRAGARLSAQLGFGAGRMTLLRRVMALPDPRFSTPRVMGLAGRPVRLLWRTQRGQVRSWVPQLFARHTDGTALLADCPSHTDAGGERAQNTARAMEEACAHIGWTYRRLPPLDDILAANLRWLAGYRHPRNAGRPGLTSAVLEAFARPRPLIEGAEATGDPIEVLSTVFHSLWHGQLTTDLNTPLHERVLLGPGTGAVRARQEESGDCAARCPACGEGRGPCPLPRGEVAGGRLVRADHPPRRPGRRW
ncbi:TnsA-like heteromeric transposase endonuclease subunit [Streptomyces sp. NPDC087845]|uniref:TnsA-like heteromeric transposase endonuclease subunit n=1 Tax=Streptomyces sp. NPDC087845 TaxID=3365806 RepID=UPI0038223497